MNGRIVVVGAGQAGFQLALSLRQAGFAGKVILIGNEPGLPYQRPPLSKAYLLDRISLEELLFRPRAFFAEHDIQTVSAQAVAIDRAGRRVFLDAGAPLAYDRLVLATGARRRLLQVTGAGLSGVHGLATMADADTLKKALLPGNGGRATVIGGGFIGMEFASVARHLGMEVTVIDAAPRLMARSVSPTMSAHFEAYHAREGIRFRFEEGISSLEGSNGRVAAVATTSGEQVATDIVVTGIGVVPNEHLASQAGLAVDNGILVDEALRTSDPDIFAIGDCCNFPLAGDAMRCRLESVQNATDQARYLAARFTAASEAPYHAIPWFWSEQGALKLQIAGLSAGCDTFVPQPAAAGLTVFCFRGDHMQAVETVNRPGEHMAARKLLSSSRRPTPAEAAKEGFTLKQFSIDAAPSH